MDKQGVYQRVAQLHAENIDQGFLSSLGPRFMGLLYQAIDESSASALILAWEDEQIVGFVSGALGMRPVYRQLLRHWLRLMLALAPSLLIPGRLWRIIEILRYSRGGHDAVPGLPSAELLSIVVDPAFRGQQHSDRLYRQLAYFFSGQGEQGFKVIVGGALKPAHRFYQRMGAQLAAEIEVHRGACSTVYVQELSALWTSR